MKRNTPLLLASVLLGLVMTSGGCLTNSLCRSNSDCSSVETCNMTSGECEVQCRVDQDCWPSPYANNGKICVANRCDFRYDQRPPAPEFHLRVVNPKSVYYNKVLSLSQLRGKVVLIFFGLIA